MNLKGFSCHAYSMGILFFILNKMQGSELNMTDGFYFQIVGRTNPGNKINRKNNKAKPQKKFLVDANCSFQ
jgi:hypothetical protein